VAECCEDRSPAVVTPLRPAGPGLRAAFFRFRTERVELELTDLPAPTIGEGTLCHVSFLHREEPVIFTAPLRERRLDGEHLRIRLAMPEQLSSEAERVAFRIPAGNDPVTVDLKGDDGAAWQAELVNVSLSGTLLYFPAGRPMLMPDQVVELAVRVAEEPVRLAAVVRRLEDERVAFFFPDASASDSATPIRRIVAALERDWHSQIRR